MGVHYNSDVADFLTVVCDLDPDIGFPDFRDFLAKVSGDSASILERFQEREVWWLHQTRKAIFLTRNRSEGEDLGGSSDIIAVSDEFTSPSYLDHLEAVYLDVMVSCFECHEGEVYLHEPDLQIFEDEPGNTSLHFLTARVVGAEFEVAPCPYCDGDYKREKEYRYPSDRIVDVFLSRNSAYPERRKP